MIDAFTTETVMRLTGLSRRQLAYWDKTNFFSPTHRDAECRGSNCRVYSFRDLVGLRTLAMLRSHGVSLQELRKVGSWLRRYDSEPWSRLRFLTAGGKVYIQEPGAEAILRASEPAGQAAIAWNLASIAAETQQMLTSRSQKQVGTIDRRRSVLNNAVVIAGTRIPTSIVYDFHKAGYSAAAIIDEYPQLGEEDIRAAIEYEERSHNTKAAS